MNENRDNRRFWEVMGGLALLLMGLATISGGGLSILSLGLVLLGLYVLMRQFNQTTTRMNSGETYVEDFDSDLEEPSQQHAGTEQVYSHALKAAQRAGQDPGGMQVLPVDIGVMAFRADRDPVVHRTQPVLDDVDYIQPFVQLRLPTRAVGRVRFEICDSDGQVLFIHEDNHQLQRGRNLITPSSRLPIHDAQVMHGNWELSVSADGVQLATHKFGWRESTEKVVRRHLQEDGEINADMRAAINDSQPGNLSLDDLLSYQEEDEQQQGGRR